MPRQSNGSYLAPGGTAAVSGQAISSAAFNTLQTDIGTEIGNSVDRYGRGAMAGALNMGSHSITNVAAAVNPQDAVPLSQLQTVTPSGAVIMFAGAAAPTGWLACDGSAVSRTTYATLFAAIGGQYGSGDGSTTFNLPNLQTRIPIGVGSLSGDTTRALGATGGAETHTLTAAELPVSAYQDSGHGHPIYDPGHTHAALIGSTSAPNFTSAGAGTGFVLANVNSATTGVLTQSASASISNPGGGNAHSIMPPFIALNFIIKT